MFALQIHLDFVARALSEMQPTLVVKRGAAWLNRFEGVVLHGEERLQQHIGSTGGGGYVGPNGGYVAAPQITSTTTEHQTLFVRDANGVESNFQWSNWTLPVRPGSRIAVVWGARTGRGDGSYVGAINLDTGDERWRFEAWFKSQGLVTARVRGWLCFFVSLLMAGALVYGFAYQELRGRPRPEQITLDEATVWLASTLRDSQQFQAEKPMFGRFQQPSTAGSPQRVAAARKHLEEAHQDLRRASTSPYDPHPKAAETLALVSSSGLYQAIFWASWCVLFVVLIFVAVVSSARGSDDERTEKRMRDYLHTGQF